MSVLTKCDLCGQIIHDDTQRPIFELPKRLAESHQYPALVADAHLVAHIRSGLSLHICRACTIEVVTGKAE